MNGDLLAEFDAAAIEAAGSNSLIMMIVTSSGPFPAVADPFATTGPTTSRTRRESSNG